MKFGLIGLTSALIILFTGIHTSYAATLSQLTAINGPTAGAPALPVPLLTVFPDNDENPAQINFAQFVTTLQITGTSPVDFEFLAAETGSGGTTEYMLNPWITNATGTPWSELHYSLSARDLAGAPLVVPGLDFDWPDKTALGQGATNFPSLIHEQYDLWWDGGIAGIGANEITALAIDVPDIGQDYVVVLTLEVPEPMSAIGWVLMPVMLTRRCRHLIG